jgi:hypothetical protein
MWSRPLPENTISETPVEMRRWQKGKSFYSGFENKKDWTMTLRYDTNFNFQVYYRGGETILIYSHGDKK